MTKRSLLSWSLLVLTSLAAVGIAGNLAVERLGAFLRKSIQESVHAALEADDCNLTRARARIAAHETALFINEHMPKVRDFPHRFALLEHSLQSVDPSQDGLYCEFGVYKGETVNFIASKVRHTVHGFDSFEGLPETWRTGFETGTFKLSNLPEVRANVRLHKGWFSESLPPWAKEHPGPVVFMHMDADLYSSTKDVLDILGDRIVPGTVIQFDEFFNYPGWEEGEYRAFMEFVKNREVKFEYIGYTSSGNAQQAAVRILHVSSRPGE